jgi:hypothetical protein
MRKENNTDKYRKLTKQKATKVARLCFIDSAEKEEPGCTQLIRQSIIYFLVLGVWLKALPATDLLALLVLLSRRIFEAVEATLRLVCFFVQQSTPF